LKINQTAIILLLIISSVIGFFINFAAMYPESGLSFKSVLIYDILYLLFWLVLIFEKRLNEWYKKNEKDN